jgi:hypothetical protein
VIFPALAAATGGSSLESRRNLSPLVSRGSPAIRAATSQVGPRGLDVPDAGPSDYVHAPVDFTRPCRRLFRPSFPPVAVKPSYAEVLMAGAGGGRRGFATPRARRGGAMASLRVCMAGAVGGDRFRRLRVRVEAAGAAGDTRAVLVHVCLLPRALEVGWHLRHWHPRLLLRATWHRVHPAARHDLMGVLSCPRSPYRRASTHPMRKGNQRGNARRMS